MTRPCRRLGKCCRRCSTTGTATLYGRFATSAVGGNGQFGHLHGVREHQVEVLLRRPAATAHSARQLLGQDRVNFDGDYGLGSVQQAQRERPQSGADLEDGLIGVDVGGGHDPADGVAVNHKVLAEGLRGAYTDFLGEPADICGAQQGCGAVPEAAGFGSVT